MGKLLTIVFFPVRFRFHNLQFKWDKNKFFPESAKMDVTKTAYEKATFFCHSAPEQRSNVNVHISSILEQMEKYYCASGDKFRERAYRLATVAVKRFPQKISERELAEIKGLRGIGGSVYDKICEIVRTGKCDKADALSQVRKISYLNFTQFCSLPASESLRFVLLPIE
jgi:hypothetical protein